MDDPCSPNPCTGGTCSRNGGGFTCTCPAGTQLSGTTCVNLCNSVNCGVGGTGCSNGQCSCRSGYQQSADKKTCVDRCLVVGAVPCSGPMASCTAGTCTCGGGNVLRAGGICESSTECNSTSFVCIGGQCTLDETNQRVCRCPPGMKLDATNKCVDIDECADGTDDCVAPATCVNQFGATYACSCEKHNMMNGENLVLKNQFECGQPCQKNCNGVGTCNDGTCDCQTGYVPDPNNGCRAQCPNDCSGKGTCTATGSCVCTDPAEQSLDCSGGSGGSGEGPEGPGDTNAAGMPSSDDAASDSVTDADGNVVGSSSTDLLVIILSVVAGIILWIVLVLLFLAWRRRRENRTIQLSNVAFTSGPDMGHYQQPPSAPASERFHYGDTNRASPYGASMAERDQGFAAPPSRGVLPSDRGYPGESQGYPGESKGYPSGPDAPGLMYSSSMKSFSNFDTASPEPSGVKPQAYQELDRSEFHRYQQ